MSQVDWTTLSGYSETTMGVFKEGAPPTEMDDMLLYIQAIKWCRRPDQTIEGEALIVEANTDFGERPFDIDLYQEKRSVPYHAIGYSGKRTLKNVVLKEKIMTGRHYSQPIQFTAEADTGWQEMDFLYGEMEA